MFDLKMTLLEYAATSSHKLKVLEDGKFCIDFRFRMGEGKKDRLQMVWCWIAKGRKPEEKCVYFSSRVGIYSPNINLFTLMKDAGRCFHSTITIVSDKNKEGQPCESIIVQASPNLKYVTKEFFLEVLFEVAETADILEERHFDGVDIY